MSIVITILILGLIIVISVTTIICVYQRRKKQKSSNVFAKNLSHIYDVPDYAKIEHKVKDGSHQVSCETEANVAYEHNCDMETNIAYGVGGCSTPQQQTSNDVACRYRRDDYTVNISDPLECVFHKCKNHFIEMKRT